MHSNESKDGSAEKDNGGEYGNISNSPSSLSSSSLLQGKDNDLYQHEGRKKAVPLSDGSYGSSPKNYCNVHRESCSKNIAVSSPNALSIWAKTSEIWQLS